MKDIYSVTVIFKKKMYGNSRTLIDQTYKTQSIPNYKIWPPINFYFKQDKCRIGGCWLYYSIINYWTYSWSHEVLNNVRYLKYTKIFIVDYFEGKMSAIINIYFCAKCIFVILKKSSAGNAEEKRETWLFSSDTVVFLVLLRCCAWAP